jgi:tetratricopeptide (TPR) repeat protein
MSAEISAIVHRALQLHQEGKLREAHALYTQALSLDPAQADAIHFLGYIAYQTGNLDTALQMMRRSLELNPRATQYHGNLGIVLMRLEHREEAEAAFRKSIEIDPSNAESHNNLGSLWQICGRHDLALQCFEAALQRRPAYPDAMNNRAGALMDLDRLDDASRQYAQVLALDAANSQAQLFLGHLRFRQGRLAEGWEGYAWRFDARLDLKYRVSLRPFPAGKWNGESLDGKTLLVHAEQGIGDQIWAAGMVGDLEQLKGAKIVIECAPKLLPLFRRSFAWAEVVARTNPPDPKCLEGVDYQISGGGLGCRLRSHLDCFPRREATGGAYLFADAERERHWRQRMANLGAGLKVGIDWRSSNVSGERKLSCTQLLQWGEILRVSGVQFVNLQYDDCAAELAHAEAAFGVAIARFPEVDMFDDLDETAALMRSMDLVISAPTSVSIMSAALGVPTWQLNYGTEWQRCGQPDNPWYPSMKTWVRHWSESWEAALGKVAAELTALVQHRGEARKSA